MISIGYSWIPYSTDDGVLKFTGDERSRKELEKLLFSTLGIQKITANFPGLFSNFKGLVFYCQFPFTTIACF